MKVTKQVGAWKHLVARALSSCQRLRSEKSEEIQKFLKLFRKKILWWSIPWTPHWSSDEVLRFDLDMAALKRDEKKLAHLDAILKSQIVTTEGVTMEQQDIDLIHAYLGK